jgi:hypothetical protein
MMQPCSVLAAALLLALLPAGAYPEVADSSAAGFTVKIATRIEASPAAVYRGFMRVGEWWDSEHTWSGDARNLSMEEKVTGCFCERLPGGGGVRHLEIVNLVPGKSVVLTGGLGPLQSLAATGTMSVEFAADGPATKLTLTYAVSGYLPAGLNTWAAGVDSVLSAQVARLKKHAEKK